MPSNSLFLEKELISSFKTDPLALQLAAFHQVSMSNGETFNIEFKKSESEFEDFVAHLIRKSPDGEVLDDQDGFGFPCQAFERFACVITDYATEHNLKVVAI